MYGNELILPIGLILSAWSADLDAWWWGCFDQRPSAILILWWNTRHHRIWRRKSGEKNTMKKNLPSFLFFPFYSFFYFSFSLPHSVYSLPCVMEYQQWPQWTSAFSQRTRKEQEVHEKRKKLWSERKMLGRITAHYKEGIFVSCIHSAHFTLHQSRYE